MIKSTEIENVRVLPSNQVSAEVVHRTVVSGVTTQEIRRKLLYSKESDLHCIIEIENNDELRTAINSLKP